MQIVWQESTIKDSINTPNLPEGEYYNEYTAFIDERGNLFIRRRLLPPSINSPLKESWIVFEPEEKACLFRLFEKLIYERRDKTEGTK